MSLLTSILTAGTNNHQTTSEEANLFATNFVTPGFTGALTNTAGVSPMTGAFAVNCSGTDKNITFAPGSVVVATTPASQGLQNLVTRNTAPITKLANDNVSGSTVYDFWYVVHDATLANNPDTAGDNVANLVVNRSTTSTSDSVGAPANSQVICRVTLTSGFTTVTVGNITDLRTAAGAAVPAGSIGNTQLAANAAWSSWTPTLTNLTVGSGTLITKFQQIGKTVHFRILFRIGAGSVVGVSPTMSTPVPAAVYGSTSTGRSRVGVAEYEHNGVAGYEGTVALLDANTLTFVVSNVAGTYPLANGLNGSVPFTWATGDELTATGSYEAA